MDKGIENAVKSCEGCALAAKVLPIKFNPWPKMDLPGSRIHIVFAGPLKGYYYLIIVDSFSKWPKVLRCKNPTTEIMIKFLYELFARFGVVDTLGSDNVSEFTSGEFRDFCETYQVKYIQGLMDWLKDLWIIWREFWKNWKSPPTISSSIQDYT